MRNRFQNFMEGRYGGDPLNQTIIIVALGLAILNMFLRRNFWILWFITMALLIIYFWRMFSTNTSRRAMENEWFVGFFSRFRGNGGGARGSRGYGGTGGRGSRGYGGNQDAYSRRESAERKKSQRQDNRYYKYFNCPNCNQKVRVPKGKGKIEITCPKCRTSFIRKT